MLQTVELRYKALEYIRYPATLISMPLNLYHPFDSILATTD